MEVETLFSIARASSSGSSASRSSRTTRTPDARPAAARRILKDLTAKVDRRRRPDRARSADAQPRRVARTQHENTRFNDLVGTAAAARRAPFKSAFTKLTEQIQFACPSRCPGGADHPLEAKKAAIERVKDLARSHARPTNAPPGWRAPTCALVESAASLRDVATTARTSSHLPMTR